MHQCPIPKQYCKFTLQKLFVKSWCQFHQHFTGAFLVQKIIAQLFLVTFWLWQKDFGKKALSYKKRACKILMKLTPGEIDCRNIKIVAL